jgi:hypothetical protein
MQNAVTIVPPHPHLLVRPSRRAGSLRPLALRASWTLRLQEMCASAAAGLLQAEDAIELCTVCNLSSALESLSRGYNCELWLQVGCDSALRVA